MREGVRRRQHKKIEENGKEMFNYFIYTLFFFLLVVVGFSSFVSLRIDMFFVRFFSNNVNGTDSCSSILYSCSVALLLLLSFPLLFCSF